MSEAEIRIGRPLGFIGFDDTPDDWDVRSCVVSVLNKQHFDCVTFVHPSGCECVVFVSPPRYRNRNPLDELNVVVRHGTDSPEHQRFLATATNERRDHIEEQIKAG